MKLGNLFKSSLAVGLAVGIGLATIPQLAQATITQPAANACDPAPNGQRPANWGGDFAACTCSTARPAKLDASGCAIRTERATLMSSSCNNYGCPSGTWPMVVPTAEGIQAGCGPMSARGGNIKVTCQQMGMADAGYVKITAPTGQPAWTDDSHIGNRSRTDADLATTRESVDLNNMALSAIGEGSQSPQQFVDAWKNGSQGKNPTDVDKTTTGLVQQGSDGFLEKGRNHLDVSKKSSNISKVGNDSLDYTSAENTANTNKAVTLTAQMSDTAGSQVVNTMGQMNQLNASQPDKNQADVYRAAAATADAAAVQQSITGTVELAGAITMGVRLAQHSADKKNVQSDASAIKDQIDDDTSGTDKALATKVGRQGAGHAGADGKVDYEAYGENADNRQTLYERMSKQGVDLNKGYSLDAMDANQNRCTDQQQRMTSTSIIMQHLDTYGFRMVGGKWVDEGGLQAGPDGNPSHPRLRNLITQHCSEQIYKNRITSFRAKGGEMKQDVDTITTKVVTEQSKGISEAGQGLLIHSLAAAMHAGQVAAQEVMAGNLRDLANKYSATAKDAPTVDTSFDPLAFNEGTGTGNTGTIVGNGSTGQFAAGAEDDKAGDEKAPNLGPGLNTGPLGNDLAKTGPDPGAFSPGDAGGKGGSSGVGGVDGASTSAATADKGADPDAAQYADMSGRGAGYGSGSTFAAGGGRKGKAGGNNGIDLNSILGQLLPGKGGDEKKDSILDYGGRGPAGGADSFLDRNVNIFDRIHDAYQDRGRKGVVGF